MSDGRIRKIIRAWWMWHWQQNKDWCVYLFIAIPLKILVGGVVLWTTRCVIGWDEVPLWMDVSTILLVVGGVDTWNYYKHGSVLGKKRYS